MKNLLLLSLFLLGIIGEASAADQWIQRSDFGNFGRHRGVAVGIGNKVYAGTGHLNGTGWDTWHADWWEYDLPTNSWTQKADYIGNGGNGDQDIVAIAIDGIGYIGMGWYGDTDHYKYDPITNTWTQLTPAPSGFFANTNPFVINGKGYYPEWGGSNSLYMYDPGTDSWSIVGPMPTTVTQRCPTFVIDGKGYFKKDYSFYEFQPGTNVWTQKTDFPGTAPNYNLGFSQNGKGYIVGGNLIALGDMYQEVWQYTPATDSWFQMEDYPFSARRWAVRAKVGEKCFVGLGTNGTNFHDFWEFNASADLNEFKLEDFQAFPTLAESHINFVSSSMNDFEITILNMSGELIATVNAINGEARFERDNLPSGVYVYRVTRNGQVLHSDRFIFN